MRSYVKLEDVADERGETPAKVGRSLVRKGCDLYLHLDKTKEYRTCELESTYIDNRWYDQHDIPSGTYRLLSESVTKAIKRFGNDDYSIEGLIFVFELETDDTFNVRFSIDDSSVFIVAKKADISSLSTPPLPAYQDGAVTGSPTARKNNFFENSGKKKKESPTELDLLLKNIIHAEEKFGEETSANAIWNIIKKEINRKTRKYDRKNILSEFVSSENLLGKIIWKKGKKLSKTSCTYRTFENKLSKTRKNNH